MCWFFFFFKYSFNCLPWKVREWLVHDLIKLWNVSCNCISAKLMPSVCLSWPNWLKFRKLVYSHVKESLCWLAGANRRWRQQNLFWLCKTAAEVEDPGEYLSLFWRLFLHRCLAEQYCLRTSRRTALTLLRPGFLLRCASFENLFVDALRGFSLICVCSFALF